MTSSRKCDGRQCEKDVWFRAVGFGTTGLDPAMHEITEAGAKSLLGLWVADCGLCTDPESHPGGGWPGSPSEMSAGNHFAGTGRKGPFQNILRRIE